MNKQVYDKISRCLDIFINRLSKIAALTPGAGLLTGKTGLALLFYEYAAYKNEKKIEEYADNLIDLTQTEINRNASIDLNDGLCGTAWGLNYLLKRGFVEADEDIFEEIDNVIFNKINNQFEDLRLASAKALYLLSRINFNNFSNEIIWQQRIETYLHTVGEILNNASFFSCQDLFLFFHSCETLRKNDLYFFEIESLYGKMLEIVDVSCKIEKNNANRYTLELLLMQIPAFSDHVSINTAWKNATLMDVIAFYQNRLITGRNIPAPKAVDSALFSIINDKSRIDELLYLLNPYNAGLGNYVGGLTWAMLQWRMDFGN
ncbi:MAG: hypothetical protein FWD60_09570 [Candidatus Azobacteroides sp.]|nr:hypothetical protein [Candidatus Azobacteroides sp.]